GIAQFTVAASGSQPLSYQWTFGSGAIGGATTALFSKTNVQASDAGNYQVIVTNTLGSVTSAVAILTVTNQPPSITNQPQSQTVALGQDATFSVGAAGSTPLGYQWRFNANDISGATTSSYMRSAVGTG